MFKIIMVAIAMLAASIDAFANEKVQNEIDAYWQFAAASVASGNFEKYVKTFHEDAILVSDIKGISYPIGDALSSWKQGFDNTKAGKMKAGVDFKFVKSLLGDTTSHQTGYFRYHTENATGEKTAFIAEFEALLVKKSGNWVVLMERHVKQIDQATWNAIK